MSTTTQDKERGSPAELPSGPAHPHRRRYLAFVIGGGLVALALLAGSIPRWQQRKQSATDTKELAVQSVAVVSPHLVTPHSGLDLPAEVKPWQEASIFSRVNGYLKSWLVDIGAQVKEGQLLAEVDVPDLQQQLDQAKSQLTLAQKNLQLAKDNNVRFQDLFKKGVVSQMDSDTQATSQATNQANAEAFAANLRFLEQEVAFQKVTAPFAGTITVRNVNVGDLITANNTNFEMFHIQQMNPLRVYFRIPQPEAPDIAVGQTFNVRVGAETAKTYQGKVINTSEIFPGSYSTVRVPQEMLGKILTLPDNTLIFQGKDLQVAVVNSKGVVDIRNVRVGRDFGVQSEILSGVTESDKVIVNPSNALATGTTVHVASSAAPGQSPTPSTSKGAKK
jgi:multidrug efflux pump subunit AcrA (membrane-fusion protein)